MLLFIKLFFVSSISLLSCYIIGAVIVRLFNLAPREKFFALFLCLVLGVSVVVSGYAIVCTHWNTVQAGVILLMFFITWEIRKHAVSTPAIRTTSTVLSINGNSLLPILLALNVIIFCLQYYILYDSTSEYLQTPFVDYVYYSRLSLPLNKLGLETNSLETIYVEFLTQQPYHYFEIWLNALLVHATSLPSAWVFFISSSAILLTIVCVGFAAIFAHFQLKTIWLLVFALLFLFVTGVKWPPFQYNSFLKNGELISATILCFHPKFAPIYIYIILASLFLLNRYYIAAGSALAILPFIFISTTPSIGIGVVTLTAYLVLTRKISWTKSFAMVTPIIVSVLCIIIFYALHPEPYKFPAEGRSISLQSIVPKLSEFRVLFNGTAGVFINYSIYFAPYIILLLLLLILRRESNVFYGLPKVIWVWFGASIVTAAVTRAFGTHYLDSFQFFSNIMMPMTPVILAILLACILRQAATESYLITLVVIVTLICVNFSGIGTGATRYSSEFMRNISHAITSTGFRGAYILDDSDYQNAYMLSSDSYTAGSYVSNFKNDYALPSLSELDVDSLSTDIRFKVDSAQAEQIIRKSSIYRFAKFQSLNKQKLSLDSIKYKYVIKNNISFICASRKAKMPLTLQPLVKVMYTDSLSGERFYLLNFKQSAVATNAYD